MAAASICFSVPYWPNNYFASCVNINFIEPPYKWQREKEWNSAAPYVCVCSSHL